MASSRLPIVLFGYDSSPFTQKVRLALRLKQIPYTFVTVPSMMPRQIFRDNFHLTYRKIPVLALGREIYCDTSIIIEALEHTFFDGHTSLYPIAADGRSNRPLIRVFASYWTDRPFFRVTTGLIPSSVWRTAFGEDRMGLIGHKLDPRKLEAKLPQNMNSLDLHLSILEPQLQADGPWLFSTPTPSLADLSLYYQLDWGNDMAAGRGLNNLTGGGTPDTDGEGIQSVFNPTRYPGLHRWYLAMKDYFKGLPDTETIAISPSETIQSIRDAELAPSPPLIPTPARAHSDLDKQIGLSPGMEVSVAPDDTGRNDPTLGTLIDLSPEEVVIKPLPLESKNAIDVRIHFPRLGFVTRPHKTAKL